jgi:adsorption protein B
VHYIEILAPILIAAKIILIGVGIIFVISGLDELFIDLNHELRRLYRALFIMPRHKALTEEQLLEKPEQAVALMIPCWDESAVIGRMLENTLKTVNYTNYHIFVGTYPNDAATQFEVERIRERYDNVHRVTCPKEGPTSKADCLNWVHQYVRVFEKEQGIRFEIFAMDDSEDIIHPLALKLYNYLIPRKDMVQLPVFPMEIEWHRFTAGHYLDEFAECHSRDMIVRERLSSTVPSAGVGTAFGRRALDLVAEDNRNQIFNIDSLTEDYDFAHRLRKYDLKEIFVRKALKRKTSVKNSITGKHKEKYVKDFICIREYFPRTFSAAVRQKSRWVVGITLQGWANLGWRGGFWTKYMYYRDRKSLITHQANLLGNIIVPLFVGMWLFQRYWPETYRFPALVEPGSWLAYLLYINAVFLLIRGIQRVRYVNQIYGWRQAFFVPPRFLWGNVINYFATIRALRLYFRYLRTGKLIAWEKTDHVYPSEEDLRSYRRKLGDLLLEKRFIAVGHLDEVLKEHKQNGKRLGQILLDRGLINEDQLVVALGMQFSVDTADIDPYAVPAELLRTVPKNLAVKYSVFPLAEEKGVLVLAVDDLPSTEAVQDVEAILGRKVEIRLAAHSDIAFAIRRGYERSDVIGVVDAVDEGLLLGEMLVKNELCSRDQVNEAAKKQRRAYKRLGNVLVGRGVLDSKTLAAAEERFVSNGSSLEYFGEFLVHEGFADRGDIASALQEQQAMVPPLGRILMDMGALSKEGLEVTLAAQQRKGSGNV